VAKKLESQGQAPAPARRARAEKKPKATSRSKDDDEAQARAGADEPEDAEEASQEDVEDGEVLDTTGEVLEDEPVESQSEGSEGYEEDESSEPSEGKGSALTRYDALQAYMREVQRHPLLSPDEEHRLAVEYGKAEDVDIAKRLVTANLRLVVKIAYEYRRAYKNMMDLIQEGNIGLMQAVKRYDPYRGVKLSSYAAWWIRAYMLRFILNNWRMVKIGTTQAQRKLFFNLSKEKAKLTAMGVEPTHEEIAKRLNVEESEVIEMDRRLSRGDASLDTPVNEGEGKSATRLELLPGEGASPDQMAESMELSELLHERLDEFRQTLSGKDVAIFEKRLIADEPLTLQELGDEFGISRERVRQLEARLAGRLREYLKEKLGDAVGVG
jgi:RNA polymerase sigma-32 factor